MYLLGTQVQTAMGLHKGIGVVLLDRQTRNKHNDLRNKRRVVTKILAKLKKVLSPLAVRGRRK